VTALDASVVAALRYQRDAPATSPMYRHALRVVVDDIERSEAGPCGSVLAHTPAGIDPQRDALPLRFLGGIHRIVLEGRAPDLARFYPSVGGTFDPSWPAGFADVFIATVRDHHDELVAELARPVQTNEVGRCAALLLGFLAVARSTGLPLRVLEIGASAGLNLRWSRYRYEGGAGGSAWGDAASVLRFEGVFEPPLPDLDVPVEVAEARGCDRDPIDATSEAGALTLRSFVWADQTERFRALDAALQLAPSLPVVLERADAADWVERELAVAQAGQATVVEHSIVWQYLSRPARHRIRDAIEHAGARASRDAPVAWLRMEPGQDAANSAEVRLTLWPGAHAVLVARTGYHGRPVQSIGEPALPTIR